MGLGNLPKLNRHNNSYWAATFNDTWGHMAPKKNVSYRGTVRFCLTDHAQYGGQPIIITYDFGELYGPYLHDKLFEYVCKWDTSTMDPGDIYDISLTFRNYRFYASKANRVL